MKKAFGMSILAIVILLTLIFMIKFKIFSKIGLIFSHKATAEQSSAKTSFDSLLKSAGSLEEQGELLHAKEVLNSILSDYASKPGIEDVEKRLESLNMRILFSAINIPGETTVYVVKENDYLQKVANEFNTTIDFIKRQNGLSSDVIRPNARLRIWTGKFSVLVDKSQNLLTLKSNDEVIRTYRVSTGKENITPVGTFKIVNKLVHPDWSHNGKVVPYGNPENILGTRWLGFDVPGYGIHGTTQPESIGQQVTAGCVRMINAQVEELFMLLPVGTEVTIID